MGNFLETVENGDAETVQSKLGNKMYKLEDLQEALKRAGQLNQAACTKVIVDHVMKERETYFSGTKYDKIEAAMVVFRAAIVNKRQDEYMELAQTLKPCNPSALSAALYCASAAEMVEWLVPLHKRGASVRWSYKNCTVLSEAAEGNRVECVKMLLWLGADPNDGRSGERSLLSLWLESDSPIEKAAKLGHTEILDALLECGSNGADLNQCLRYSSEAGNAECVLSLLNYGADASAQNEFGGTPLHYAAGYDTKNEQVECMTILIQHGAPINSRDSRSGDTPLNEAAKKRNLDTFKKLIESGADPALDNNDGETYLNLAKQESKDQMSLIVAQELKKAH